MRRKTKPLECAGRTRVAQGAARSIEFFDREDEPFALLTFRRRDAALGCVAIDTALHEFCDEPSVADGLGSAIHEQPCEEPVVDEAVGFGGLDGRAHFVFGITAPGEARPQLRFGEPALGEQTERGEARG